MIKRFISSLLWHRSAMLQHAHQDAQRTGYIHADDCELTKEIT